MIAQPADSNKDKVYTAFRLFATGALRTYPMAQLSAPSITISAVAYHPTTSFFEREAEANAARLVGSYSPGIDFEISLVPSSSKGNRFVYKTRATGVPFHAFLLGRVRGIEKMLAEQGEVASGDTFIYRMTLQTMADGSEKAAILFHNDVSALHTIMNEEMGKHHTITNVWCTEDVEDDSNSKIYVDYSENSKIVNGLFELDSTVLVDATFHRQDAYTGLNLAKAYYVVAHEVEVVGTSTLESAGLLMTRDAERIVAKMEKSHLV
ncbi:hypothetical protein B0H13DRAFT_1908813 [Mycena leptocephala]|nr:hypothetical protein B0H13DRAFT_1908813 [Mycena leptocephala]